MSQNSDYVPVFKYRGAVSKKDILAQAETLSDEEEELSLDFLNNSKKKSAKRTKETKPKTKAKLTKKTRSTTESSTLSSAPSLANSTVISLDEEDDELPFVATHTPIQNPQITQTLHALQSSQNIIRSLKNSVQLPSSRIEIDEEEEEPKPETKETIVIQVKEKESNQTLKFRIYSDDRFQKVVDNVIKYKDLSSDAQIVLKLDGIPLKMNQTPKELSMLDNDVIYVTITRPTAKPLASSGNSAKSSISTAVAIDDGDDVFVTTPAPSTSTLKKSTEDLKLPLKPKEMSLPLKSEPSTTKQELAKSSSFTTVVEEEDEGVKLKIRMKGKTEPLKLKLGKNATFAKLIDKCCSEWKLDPKKAKFTFDGDVLHRDSTPADHDMEDGDLIDVLQ